MNLVMNQVSDNIVKYPVAHIKISGVDLVIVLLDTSFAGMGQMGKAEVLRSLQQHAAAAGLRGTVVPIWDNGRGGAEFLAERQLLPYLKNLSLSIVQSKINRELVVKGAGPISTAGPRMTSNFASAAPKPADGLISVVAEIEDCEVFIDGSFVGHIPARVRTKEGIHVVEVRKAGFKTYREEIEVTGGSEFSLRPNLERNDSSSRSYSANGGRLQSAMDQRGKLAEFQRKHRVGLVTLLFTDMVGSTKLKQELGDHDAVSLMQRHHGIVRDILHQFPGGEEISTAGDSFFLAFAKPSDAVKFSLLLQSKLREVSKGSKRPLLDRIGIHVGEVFIEENQGAAKPKDLYGIQVDTCARVMSLGEGDQILMTRFAYDNARQVLKGQQIEGVSNLTWVSHGRYVLKGVDDPEEICEVGEAGLAVLKAPSNSEKVQKFGSSEGESGSEPHVVVSTKTVFSKSPWSSR
jgi:class 3 adenylate cyclase